MFLTMASHGTDQLMVQRMLAARNLRESRLALLSSGGVIFLQFTLFLLIGVGLYVFYGLHPTVFASADRIFPTFIVREMPVGVAGLLVAAILAAAMSNLSAALNSLSSTTVVDFYMHWRPEADERERMMISRSSTVVWALVLFAVAVYSVFAGGKGHVDPVCDAVGSYRGHDLWVRAEPSPVARSQPYCAWPGHDSACCVYLVRFDWLGGYVRC